jgi:hypothetical protein
MRNPFLRSRRRALAIVRLGVRINHVFYFEGAVMGAHFAPARWRQWNL